MPLRSDHPKYEILDVCGSGGMGIVYRARDRQLNRIVALKFLGPDLDRSAEALGRFQREAESIAALNHPNVATLFEVGDWDGDPFLALEFLPRGTLKERLRPGGLELGELLPYAHQLGAGLAFAHQQGILHRDVKPSNGMFSVHGVLKLVDFGLAKSDSTAVTGLSHTGSAVGTIGYMAPEILNDLEYTARSDLYSFGALVYEMATGRPLYSGATTFSLMKQILTGTPEPLASLRPDLPSSFCDAVTRATAREPRERFGSVQEFLSELDRSSKRESVTDLHPTAPLTRIGSSTPVSNALPTMSLPRERRKSRIAAWLIAASLGVGLAAFGILRFLVPAAHQPETVVVLPFENLGNDLSNQTLADGLQETVISILSRPEASNSGIQLIPSSEIRRSQIHSIADARKQFNATLALTGSVQKTSEGLQLTLNVSDASTQRQKNSRILNIPNSQTADLPGRLAGELRAMLGTGSLAAPGIGSGQTTRNAMAYEAYLQGVGAIEAGQFDQAEQLLSSALKADPQFALARAKLAEAYVRKNGSSKDPKWIALADSEVNRAGQSGSSTEVLLVQAMIRQATGDHTQAIQLFHQLLAIDPNNIDAYRLLADSLDAAGRTNEAEQTYQEAIRLRPGYWPLYNALGLFYLNKRSYPKAEQMFQTAISIAPDIQSPRYNLGAVYFQMNRWDEAAKEFERSIAIKPTALSYANLGTVRFFQGNYPEAAKQTEQATKLQPANAQNWGNLGDALWQIPGQREKARQAFEQAALLASRQLGLNPSKFSLRKSYALYLAKLNRNEEAVAEIERAITQSPEDMDVRFYAARVYSVVGDRSRALAALANARALGSNAKEIDQEPDLSPLRKDPRYGYAASKK
jgi:eukaryotic-like serine/threonine-protein kinase